MATNEYPWYNKVNQGDGINQGDLIFNCPILIPMHDLKIGTIKANIFEADVIIMSQSCDIIQQKLELVLVCPYITLKELEKKNSWFISPKNKEKLRQGNQPNYHLLNKCDLLMEDQDYLVVDFRSVFSVPYSFLVEFVKKQSTRIRLMSPYREHLSQAFARFFMRVGLPTDIPQFS